VTHPYYYYITETGVVKILIPIVMSQEKKTECDVDNCPGLLEQASQSCVVCQAVVHPTCFMSSVRKLNEYPSSCHDEVFCSGVCCNWQGKEGLDLEAIRKERSELAALLKKDLVKLASTAQVRVTQRVNNASRQMSKPMMVRRLVAAKFGAGVEQATKPAAKTIHDKFRLLNCLFSDEIGALAASAETVSRADLDNGAVGGKSNYWKVVAQRFNEGFPEGSVDGKVFADKVHFLHPNIQQHHETVNPAVHGSFSSEELRKMWKDIQSDYDKVMINFTKSGNHNSNFTKAAIIALRDQGLLETTEEDFDDADEDDVFGVEEGGFCNFTNSIVIIYLRMWLNERPGLVNFVSRQIPGQIQVDSMATSAAAVSETKNSQAQRRSPDLLASAIKELAEARKRPAESVDPGINESINKILKFSTKKEEIDLITMQINGLKQRMAATLDNVKKDRYAQGIEALEEKLDELLFNSAN
jgi:hypothetical protein